MLGKWKRALHDYGIVHEKIGGVLEDVLNVEVIDKVLAYLCG